MIMTRKKLWIGGASAAILVASFLVSKSQRGNAGEDLPEFEVQRGDLVIDVLEGGNIFAIESLVIENKVKRPAGVKIMEIIEEGYRITEEDVKNEKILVKLDPSDLEEEIVSHDVQFQQTEASYAEAKQNLEIQESEMRSELKSDRQILRFALLDFQKFVGEKAAREVLQSLDLPFDNESLEAYEAEATELVLASFNSAQIPEPQAAKPQEGAAKGEEGAAEVEPAVSTSSGEDSQASKVPFGDLLAGNQLSAGEAEQMIRRMHDEALVAKTQLSVVEESVEGAKRLHEREFITRQTLDNEIVNLEKAKLALQTKETELELFQDYEFPKTAEKMLSLYEEALLELIRDKRESYAHMARFEAVYRSAKRRYELEFKQRADLQEQLESCVIRAEKPGLIAYGGGNLSYYANRYYDAIGEGATLKLGQPIITIPNMSKLGVDVDIHESHIKKLKLGQKAFITADAVPDATLEGTVSKVAVLPDSNASRYNPSLKVYPSTIEIEGTHEFLKPGMNAKVEIIVNELEDVLFVPVQAVFVEDNQRFVFVKEGKGYEKQLISIGEHNDEFIQVIDGLTENNIVALRMPDGYQAQIEKTASSKPTGTSSAKGKRKNGTGKA